MQWRTADLTGSLVYGVLKGAYWAYNMNKRRIWGLRRTGDILNRCHIEMLKAVTALHAEDHGVTDPTKDVFIFVKESASRARPLGAVGNG